MEELDNKTTFHVFLCGHVYHQTCLQKEAVFECKQCTKTQLELSKIELKKAALQLKGQAKDDAEAQEQVKRAKQLADEF